MASPRPLNRFPLDFDYDLIPYADLKTDGRHRERLSLGLDVSLGLFLPVLQGPNGALAARANSTGALLVDTSGTAGAGTTELVDNTGAAFGTGANPLHTVGGAPSASRYSVVNNDKLITSSNTADIDVSAYSRILFLLYNSGSAGAGSITYYIEVKGGLEGAYYTLYTSPAVGGAVGWTEKSIGPGLEQTTNIGDTIRVRWGLAPGWSANAVNQTVFLVFS